MFINIKLKEQILYKENKILDKLSNVLYYNIR